MKKLALLLVFALFVSFCACGGDTPSNIIDPPVVTPPSDIGDDVWTGKLDGKNFLFIGNSLTHYNEMPQIFAALAKAGGSRVTAEMITEDSTSLARCASSDTTVGRNVIRALGLSSYDYVSLQFSRRATSAEDTVAAAEVAGAKKLADIALGTNKNTQFLVYSVFPINKDTISIYTASADGTETAATGTLAMSRAEQAVYLHSLAERIAKAVNATVVPVGPAFESLAEETIVLYDKDLAHPTYAGSYLAACVFYAQVTGEKTEGLDFHGEIAVETALTLQRAADKIVFGN